jgi:hypothetical protein|tara:strand:+ start:219 stop:449 length:231 start_codon:yes stop_codon:yes gene_type:complete
MTVRIWIDPPEGWRYGFPMQIPVEIYSKGNDAIGEWFLANGIPANQIKMAVKHHRHWSDMRKTRLDRLIEKLSSNV